MSLPLARVNNFIQGNEDPYIDLLSKIFIIIELSLGLNRTFVLGNLNLVYRTVAFIYVVISISTILYLSINISPDELYFLDYLKITEYSVCICLGFLSCRRLKRFYTVLNDFDLEVSCRPKVPSESWRIMVQLTSATAFLVFNFIYTDIIYFVPLYLIHIIESHYFGHLFNLLLQRLRLLNLHLELSLSKASDDTRKKMKQYSFFNKNPDKSVQFPMNRIMDLYYIIIDAYDLVMDAIKWQLLFILMMSFLYTLSLSYTIALGIILGNMPIFNICTNIALAITVTIPLIAPCLSCDLVRAEVRKLRELLASKLYETKLDKCSRSVARALLALTNARNLSFSLLRMIDISISLPFSYLGFLATYLIILLQFEKVIYPNTNNVTKT